MTPDRKMIPVTILICDDDEDDRLLSSQALEEAHLAGVKALLEQPGKRAS